MNTINGYRVDPAAGVVFGRRGRPIAKKMRGYLWVLTTRDGKTVNVGSAHRMIWEAVHGEIPDGLQINHINGDKTDNRIANLELVTASENTTHAYRIGLARADGEFNGRHIGKRRRMEQSA